MQLSQLTVVAVDDEQAITYHLKRNLQNHCKNFIVFNDSQEAFSYINSNYKDIDILISDIRMPNLTGIDLCKGAKLLKKEIVTILLSASNDASYLIEAINEDIDKFISKPYRLELIIETLENYAKNIINAKIAKQYAQSEEIRLMQENIICMLGNVVENRSKETGLHVKRVSLYCEVLGKKLKLDEHRISLIKTASYLHDLGKIAIDDNILNKPSKLSEEEFEIIKTHTTKGYEILKTSSTPLLQMASKIAYTHHENWDGTGYPLKLKGKEIPLEGRIVAICDVFDALTYDRCYKKAWSLEKTLAFIKEQKNKKFDPLLVDIFIESFAEIKDIYAEYYEI